MKARLLTSLGIVATLALMFVLKVYVSSYFFDVLFLAIAMFAAYEMSGLLTRAGRHNNTYIILAMPAVLTCATILGIHFSLGFGYTILIDVVLVAAGFLTALVWSLATKKSTLKEMKIREYTGKYGRFCATKALNTLIGIAYPTFLFLMMLFLNHFDAISLEKAAAFDGKLSLFVVLFAFLIPIFTDSFAMLTGMVIGGPKIAPKISPKKTISGAIGGTIFCILLSACVYLILGSIDYFVPVVANFELWKFIIITTLGSAIAQCGDLLESFIKRKAGVKDSGKILPGHGGMMDRFDSYFLLVPYLLLAVCFILV